MTEPTLHGLDKDLSAHVADCSQWRQRIGSDIKGLKKVVLIAFGILLSVSGAAFVALSAIAWSLLSRGMKVP